MKQKKIKTLLLAGVITLVGSSVVACTEDAESLPSPCNEFITFDKPEIKEASSLSTRTVGDANENSSVYIGSKILRSKKNEVMHLHVLEDDFFTQRGIEGKSATRGTLVTSEAGITNFGVSSSAYPASGTYTSYGLGSYFYKQAVTANTPTSYFWPTSGYKVSFFAYYPYNNAAFTVSSSAVTNKTIYDPCPPNFCVPTGNLFRFICNYNSGTMTTWDSTNNGATWNINVTGKPIWFPAAGYRDSNNSNVVSHGAGFYWSTAASGDPSNSFLCILNSKWLMNGYGRSNAMPIRPVAE